MELSVYRLINFGVVFSSYLELFAISNTNFYYKRFK